MLEFQSLGVNGLLMWKQAVFDFAPGVTSITGANRSGKTVFFKAMTLALWGAGLGKRGTEAAKLPAGSKIDVAFGLGKNSWIVEAQPSKVALARNGKSLRMHGKTMALDRLREEMPLTPQLYDISVHLTGTTSHPLTHASPATRLDWFSSILRIDDMYDALEDAAARKAREADTSRTQLEALEAERNGIADVAAADLKGMREQLAALAEKQGKLRERMTRATDLYASLSRLRDLPKTASSDEIKTLTAKVAKLRRRLDAALEAKAKYESYVYAKQERKRLMHLQEAAERVLRRDPPDDAERMRKAARAFAKHAEGARPLFASWKREAPVRSALAKLPAPALPPDVALKTMGRADALADSLVRWARSREKCPVCLRKTDRAHAHAHIERGFKQLVALHDKVKKSSLSLRFYELDDRLSVRKEPVDPTSLLFVQKRLEEKADRAQRAAEAKREAVTALKRLPKIDAAAEPLSTKETAQLEERLDALQERLVAATSNRDVCAQETKRLEALGVTKITPDLHESNAKELGDLRARLPKIEAAHLDLTAKLAGAEKDAARRRDLDRRIERLRAKAKRHSEYLELREAFGKRGLRLHTVQRFVTMFENVLNETAPLLWSMPVSFSFTTTEKGITMLLTRNGLTSDLTTLSGSEERVWKLLCAMALIRLLPDSLRADTLILDEIEAHMDAKSRHMFATSFMDALRALVPKIIIVSPLTHGELPITADRRFEVVRKGVAAKLVAA